MPWNGVLLVPQQDIKSHLPICPTRHFLSSMDASLSFPHRFQDPATTHLPSNKNIQHSTTCSTHILSRECRTHGSEVSNEGTERSMLPHKVSCLDWLTTQQSDAGLESRPSRRLELCHPTSVSSEVEFAGNTKINPSIITRGQNTPRMTETKVEFECTQAIQCILVFT